MSAPGTGKTRTGRLWVYARDERPWDGAAPPTAWYRFSPDGRGAHPRDHLSRFKGWMHADGYASYEELYRDHGIKEVACMAHIRRKFVDLHRSQGSAIAEKAIRRIAELYAIEKDARGSPPDQRAAIRRAKAWPVIDDLQDWLHAQWPTISGKSPLSQAIRNAVTTDAEAQALPRPRNPGARQQHRRTRHASHRSGPQELPLRRVTRRWTRRT